MKYILILFCLMACACTVFKSGYQKGHLYSVYKIDSINNYYLIYARSNDSLYKIVSKKSTNTHGDYIRINKRYPFQLHSMLSTFKINGVSITPQTMNVNCFSFDKETSICLEGDSIRNLYQGDNIHGLYFLRK